jgi:hypothetical protein
MTTRLSVIALLFATGAAVLVGQGRELPQLPDPFPQRPPTPTFRSGIDLVQVDAYVTDENGKPVTGLTADDFEVFEDGKPQVITTFTPVNIPIEQSEALPFDAEPAAGPSIPDHHGRYGTGLGAARAIPRAQVH